MTDYMVSLLSMEGPLALIIRLTAYLAVCWGVYGLLRLAPPQYRVQLWRAATVGAFVMAILLTTGGQMSLAMPERPTQPDPDRLQAPLIQPLEATGARTATVNPQPEPTATLAPTTPPSGAARWSDWIPDMSYMLALIWSVGVLVATLATFRGLAKGRRYLAETEPGPDWLDRLARHTADRLGLRRSPPCRITQHLTSPVLAGLFRPVMVLPEYILEEQHRPDLMAALAHELAHVRHHDSLWALPIRVLRGLLWFHPLAWGLERAHIHACEACADLAAASVVGSRDAYSRSLARVALSATLSPSFSLVRPMAHMSMLRQRLHTLRLSRAEGRPVGLRDAVPAILSVIFAVVLFGCVSISTNQPKNMVGGVREANYTETVKGLNMGMIWIPPSMAVTGRRQHIGELEVSIRWGSWGCQTETPLRRDQLDGYWIGETEVTVGQFRKFVEETGYVTLAEKEGSSNSRWLNADPHKLTGAYWKNPGYPVSDNHPVACVSIADMAAYTNWLSEVTGHAFALPTEVQWEFAAAAGSEAMWYFGNSAYQVEDYGWYYPNSDDIAHPVKSKPSNAWGLYDVIGNVFEITNTPWRGADKTTPANQKPIKQSYQGVLVRKGSSFQDSIQWTRTVDRAIMPEEHQTPYHGFRVVRIAREGEAPDMKLDARVEGAVTINGEPWDPAKHHLELAPVSGSVPTYALQPLKGGRYSVNAKPGKYVVTMRGEDNRLQINGAHVLRLSAGTKQNDLTLRLTTLQVKTVFSEPCEPRIGVIEVHSVPPGGEDRYLFSQLLTGQEEFTTISVLPGDYHLHYKSYTYRTPEDDHSIVKVPSKTAEAINATVKAEPKEKIYYYRTIPLDKGAYEYRIVHIDHGDKRDQFIDPDNPQAVTLPDGSQASRFTIPGGALNVDGTRAEWPKVNDETNEVTFRYLSEDWTDIWVAGSFNNWNTRDIALAPPTFTFP